MSDDTKAMQAAAGCPPEKTLGSGYGARIAELVTDRDERRAHIAKLYEWLEAWQKWALELLHGRGRYPDSLPDDGNARVEIGELLSAAEAMACNERKCATRDAQAERIAELKTQLSALSDQYFEQMDLATEMQLRALKSEREAELTRRRTEVERYNILRKRIRLAFQRAENSQAVMGELGALTIQWAHDDNKDAS